MTTQTARTVLVTGGSRGIGLACARAFAADGHRVAVTFSSTPVDEPGILAVKCDVTDPEQLDAAVSTVEDQLGPVEVLVANAGITRDGLLVRMSEADFTDVIETNLTATWRLAKRVIPKMMRARWGRVIVVSSVGAYIGASGQSNYAASKAGLIGLARAIASEYGPRGITANVVAPGPIDTDMLAEVTEERRAAMVAQIPVARTGTPDEVAAAVTFLASEPAAFITGAVLPVDGGIGMGF
ncbi:MAG TPA: 3-oxoacyl-ACP reductase FabG [Acidimicrobiales bacterium]|nr:3-oxoacyl-ACP reductase FabG [Acidimicrobiales bacterium]